MPKGFVSSTSLRSMMDMSHRSLITLWESTTLSTTMDARKVWKRKPPRAWRSTARVTGRQLHNTPRNQNDRQYKNIPSPSLRVASSRIEMNMTSTDEEVVKNLERLRLKERGHSPESGQA